MIMLNLFQGHKDGSKYVNQPMWDTTLTKGKKKIPHDFLNICRNCIWQNSILIHDKKSPQNRDGGAYLNTTNTIYKKHTANIILSGEKLKDFTLNSGTRQGWPLKPPLFDTVLEWPQYSDKKNKIHPNWKRRSKSVTSCRWQDTLYRKP